MSCTVKAEDIKRVKALGFLHNRGTNNFNARVITRNGLISADQSIAIGNAANKYGNGTVCYTTRLTVEVPGIPYEKIDDFIKDIQACGLDTGGTGSKVRPVVSCKGTTCQYGLLDSFGLSEKIHERFYVGYRQVRLPHKFKIAVGGCPNNCVKPDLNDLGIIGQRKPSFDEDLCNGCKKCQVALNCPVGAAKVVDGILTIDETKCNNCGRCVGKCPFDCMEEATYGYRIYIGGRWGKSVAHGKMIDHFFENEDEVLEFIEKAILLFREQGKTGERFATTIERLGFENVQAQLLGNEILERKQAILDAKLHIVGGATC
ncbi:MAG: 4Fe-4S dicluster domain-containing protein [Traorella sp.]